MNPALRIAAVLRFLLVLWCLPIPGSSAEPVPGEAKPIIGPQVLAQLEKEVTRLEAQAEKEPGPNFPPPSAQVAYNLLAGFAAHGSEVEGLSEAEAIFFQVYKGGGTTAKLLSIAADARVAMISNWMQDKAGSYNLKTAILFVHRDGRWMQRGKGCITTEYKD